MGDVKTLNKTDQTEHGHSGLSFIEVQLPISRLSKESYKERKANAGQTLTALGSYWKGRKPLILVRAVILGLLLPVTNDTNRDRAIFLKIMLMDDVGLLKRRKPFDGKMATRVATLLPEKSWSHVIAHDARGYTWIRDADRTAWEAVEQEAFLTMGLDERLRHCLRPEELPDDALDDVWDEVNSHLDTHARTLPNLIEELGVRRFGRRPRVGDPFCGGGSIPFEAARLGCDVFASDLNPIACLLTWGALNIVGGSPETRDRIAAAQQSIVQSVDAEITKLGVEHDGEDGDLRLPADAPNRWPHGWRIGRDGTPAAPEAQPYTARCPITGWQVPMIDTKRISERRRAILALVPDPLTRTYSLEPRVAVSEADWENAATGTVVRDQGELFLEHDAGADAERPTVRARIANRAKAFLYCLETLDPDTGWRVPLAPSWLISKNYRTIARLSPDPAEKRFDIEVVMGAQDDELTTAQVGTVEGGDLRIVLEGREHRTSIERLRGEMRLRARYQNRDEEARDRARFDACRNRFAETAANDIRLWDASDFVPHPDDVFQERLYAIQWLSPDGRLFFTSARSQDLRREDWIEAFVRESLPNWQEQGLVPDSRIEPGEKIGELIRTRGWTHWHHLFSPRHLLIGATIRGFISKFELAEVRLALALVFCPVVDRMSKLTHWRIGFAGSEDTAQAADAAEHVFYNQALNTFFNYGARSAVGLRRAFFPSFKHFACSPHQHVTPGPASEVATENDLWISDPPYADAVQYHEILEYFLAWLAKDPPHSDWRWDSRRALAIRGESVAFRRAMVDAYATMTAHTPDGGFQVVMFTHQDVGVWADLAEILWAAGLHVTAGWCVATETESATRVGNYVQGTVLLVLRKRIGNEAGFIARLQRPVEQAVLEKLQSMRALDEGEDPNFGDPDYQLAAYAAALEVLTRFATIDGRPVAGETSDVERLLRRARRMASDFLVPDRLARTVWEELEPEERFYLKGLDLERAGETRSSAYQEMARGFGVDHRPMLASAEANKVRLKTAGEFARRDLRRAGTADMAETHALQGFAGGLVRHALYGIHAAREAEALRPALDWFATNIPAYWDRQRRLIEVLDYLGTIRTHARADEASTARDLRGAVDNHRPS